MHFFDLSTRKCFDIWCNIDLYNVLRLVLFQQVSLMKRENCVEVKNVNKLSVPYLTRFFSSVGPIAKIEKDDISKYVTIQFANKVSVDRVFRFEGRVLDERPIKIKKLKEIEASEVPLNLEKVETLQEKSSLQLRDQSFFSNGSQEELFLLIHNEIKPHRLEDNQHLILAIFIWRLADELSTDIRHFINYKVNMRSSYLKIELQRQIIQRINRKSKNILAITDTTKSLVLKCNDSQAVVWFSVPYPNTEEEQCRVEAASLMTKCIVTIRNQLSIRIADILSTLYSASMYFDNEETKVDTLINLNSKLLTSYDDSFEGIIENIGAKNIFFDFKNFELPNSCVYLRQSKVLERFQCTLRLKCTKQCELRECNWYNFYRGQLCRKINSEEQQVFYVKNKYKIENIKLGEQSLVFEHAQFSLFRVGKEIVSYKQVASHHANVEIIYIVKQAKNEKVMQFKKVYEDPIMQIENEVEEVSAQRQKTQLKTEQFQEIKEDEEFVSWINIIQIKFQNANELSYMKLSQYLQNYIEENITSRGFIIVSREIAYLMAQNIIQRQKQNRLFDFAQRKYSKYIGDEIWRLYQNRTERNTKDLLAKYFNPKSDK